MKKLYLINNKLPLHKLLIKLLNVIFIIYVIIMLMLISGCGSHGSNNNFTNDFFALETNNIESLIWGDGEFSLASETVTILGKEYNNIWQYGISSNKRYLITSEIRNHNQPNIFLYDLEKDTETQLSNNDYINYCCVVNDNGAWAYATYNSSNICEVSASNNMTIKTNPVTNLVLDETNNVYIVTKFKHLCSIQRIEYNEMSLHTLKVFDNLNVTKLYYISTGKLLLQAFENSLGKTKIFVYDVASNTVTKLINRSDFNSEIIRNYTPLQFNIDCFENYSSTIYSYLELIDESPSLALSDCNNFQGRLSWNISYKAEALLRLYKKTNHQALRYQLSRICSNLLNNQNYSLGLTETINAGRYGWAAKKYSLDKNTLLNLLVDDAKVLYPLLLMANTKDLIMTDSRDLIKQTAISIYDYYEDTYLNGHYYFKKGCSFWADGIVLPWNQQNAFGLCCIEMYKLTGDVKYKKRAIQLARAFKEELINVEDRLVWCYWPNSFYEGWSEDEKLSINTPSRLPSIKSCEDVSHAGINVKFIIEIVKNFPNEIFTNDDVNLLENTANSLIDKNSFFKDLYIESDAIQSYNDVFPVYGWADLNSNINSKITAYIESGNVFFDNEIALIYLAENNLNDDVILERMNFDYDLKLISSQSLTRNFNDYFFAN